MSQYIIHELYRVTRRLLRDYNEQFLVIGITAQQVFLLHELLSHGHAPASYLADRCGLDRATITNLMNQLETKRLIKRTISKIDRRSVEVDLMPTGRRLAEKLAKMASQFDELLSKRIGDERVEQFLEYLQELEM